MSSGTICTPNDQSLSANSTALRCYTRAESLGLLIAAEAAVVSLVAVSCVLGLILFNLARGYFTNRGQRLRLNYTPMDLLMLSLFIADALQACGGVINAKWVHAGKVEMGTLCDAQGIIQNVGETAVAIFNLAISTYTFIGLWWGKGVSSTTTMGVIAVIWLFVAIIVTVGNAIHPGFQSPTPYWCWISQDYMVWRIVAEYMWFWIALLFSLLAYIPLWCLRDIETSRWRQALVFLAYPLTYCVCILPLSFTRWIGFVEEAKKKTTSTPSAAIFAGTSLFALSGFFNVVLLVTTRRRAILFGESVFVPRFGRPPDIRSQEDEEKVDVQTVERNAEEQLEVGPGRLSS